MAILASQQTSLIDDAQIFRDASLGEQIFVLEGWDAGQEYPAFKKPDRFGSAQHCVRGCGKARESQESESPM